MVPNGFAKSVAQRLAEDPSLAGRIDITTDVRRQKLDREHPDLEPGWDLVTHVEFITPLSPEEAKEPPLRVAELVSGRMLAQVYGLSRAVSGVVMG